MTGAAVGSRTASLVERAERLFPGGVNSPVRAFRAVGRPPLVLDRGDGPHVWDADGRRYIDYIGAWGPAILGHAHPAVIAAITKAAGNGLALGATHPLEIELAEAIVKNAPLALIASKQIIQQAPSWTEEEGWAKQGEISGPVFVSEDADEGIAAFREKRKAEFKGR